MFKSILLKIDLKMPFLILYKMYFEPLFIPVFDLYSRYFGLNRKPKPNVVVIGYGWGGKTFCDNIDRSKYNITVIDKNNYFLNTPKLVQFTNLLKATQAVSEPQFIQDIVKTILPENKRVIMNSKTKWFDYLVVSTGSEPNTFGIKGAETCKFYKTVEDAQCLNESTKMHNSYQIVGAGPTAIEVAFELSKQDKDVTLIEATNTILPNFSDAVRNKVIEKLNEKNIKLLLNHKVSQIDDSAIHTTEAVIPRTYTLWMAGIKPTTLVKDISSVDDHLYYGSNIYVIGDSISGHGPPTAQNAKQQGIYLANHFNSNFTSEPYNYNEWCKMIHTHDALLIDYKNKCYSLPVASADIIAHFFT